MFADTHLGPPTDPLTSNKVLPPGDSGIDEPLLLGILTGTFVLLQSNAADTVYLAAHLLYAALAHRPL